VLCLWCGERHGFPPFLVQLAHDAASQLDLYRQHDFWQPDAQAKRMPPRPL
jgi:hypothetical protein